MNPCGIRAAAVIVAAGAAAAFLYPRMLRTDKDRSVEMAPWRERYIAHRGLFDNLSQYPENSLPAFQRAVDHGYGIELDVQVTADGKLVVFHDPDLQRMCGINRKLCECTCEELRQYPLAHSGQNIPLFTEVLKIVKGKFPLLVEVKPEGNWKKACQMLDFYMRQYQGKWCMESFHPLALLWFRRHRPEILRGQLSSDFFREKVKMSFPVRVITSNLLCNFLTRPDFIAYNHKYKNQFSYRLCRKRYPVENAAWTIKSQRELDAARDVFDIFIFDSFIPEK